MSERENPLADIDQELINLEGKYPQQFADAQEVVEEIGRFIGKEYTQGQKLPFDKALALDSNVGVILERYQQAKEEERTAFLKAFQLIAVKVEILAAIESNEGIDRTN